MLNLTDQQVHSLGEGRAVVLDDWMARERVAAVLEALRRQRVAGALHRAGVGRNAEVRLAPEVRGDWRLWLEPDNPDPALAALWPLFEQLRQELNQSVWLGLRTFELQAAWYPVGARYLRHLDAFAQGMSRLITAILYFTADWRPDHGGALRVYEPEGARDLEPVGGRLVLFRADTLEHEVLPPFADRWAVTAWFHGREDIPR